MYPPFLNTFPAHTSPPPPTHTNSYGATKPNPATIVTYPNWVELGCALVETDAARHPGRPIVLYGLSAGGMLAYHVAARLPHVVKGVVGMTFLDQRVQVRVG